MELEQKLVNQLISLFSSLGLVLLEVPGQRDLNCVEIQLEVLQQGVETYEVTSHLKIKLKNKETWSV